jgi:hypothetical protein
MARGMLFLILLVLLVHESWSAKDGEHCTPSCGNIQNIRYPFALKGDPETCGDPRYRLSCENNQTVLDLYAGKYYVREINYSNFRIRVSDSGIQENDNHSFIPRYLLRYKNFTLGDPYGARNYVDALTQPAVFVNCEKPTISQFYVNISACFINSSKSYRYIQVGTTYPVDVEDTCQVEQISLMTGKQFYPENNTFCSDVHNNILVYGFELLWFQAYCGNCTGRHNLCKLDYANNVRCFPVYNGTQKILILLLHVSFFSEFFS